MCIVLLFLDISAFLQTAQMLKRVQFVFLLRFESTPLGFCSLLEAGDAHFLK